MVSIKSGAWTATVAVERVGMVAASRVTVTIFCPRAVGGEKIVRTFMVGDALRTEKFDSISTIEDWLKRFSGSAGLKWGVIYSVIDQMTEIVGDFEILDVMEVDV